MGEVINNVNRLREIVASANDDLFVRYSRGPKFDQGRPNSRDYMLGNQHSGLSAVPINSEWASDDKWMARRISEYMFLKMKDKKIKGHIYRGARIGTDSDNYALIRPTEHIGTISDSLTRKLYEIKHQREKND